MTDDLVTRLREQSIAETPLFTRSLMQDAADEIERLRADRDKWAELAKKYAEFHRKFYGLEKAWDND